MIDRPKALIVAVVAALSALLLISVGFVAGKAANDDNDSTAALPPHSGDGLPAGPTGLDEGVPVGFAQTEEGALGAGVAWAPWFLSSPPGERPDGINTVLADGLDPPGGDEITTRFQFTPIAVKVEMDSDTRAVVTLLGPVLRGDVGAELTGEFWKVPVTLDWNDDAADWQISAFPQGTAGNFIIDGPLSASDVEGFQALRPAGAVVGAPIVETVPGD
jgi:hypothetical protein